MSLLSKLLITTKLYRSLIAAVLVAIGTIVVLYVIRYSNFVLIFLAVFFSIAILEEILTRTAQNEIKTIGGLAFVIAVISAVLNVNVSSFQLLGILELTGITLLVFYLYELVKR
jgi:hypothetical protein